MTISRFLSLVLFLSVLLPSGRCSAQDKLLNVLSDELKREMSQLQNQALPPYFMSYSVTESKIFWTSAAFGALTSSNTSNNRYLTISLRVGDYALDNNHEIRGDQYAQNYTYMNRSFVEIPLDLSEAAIRNAIWKETNRLYVLAAEQYSKVKANVASKIKEENQSADFSHEQKPEIFYEKPLDFKDLIGDKTVWENNVRSFSGLFLKEPDIFSANSSFRFELQRKYMVTSEGTSIVHNLTYTNLYVNGVIKSEDGMEMPDYKSYFAFQPNGIPDRKIIISDIDKMIRLLKQLHDSPEVNPYTGPAILSGRAASVFFHEIFGHRIEAHRMKKTDDAQTFRKKLNEKILPEQFSIVFDPMLKESDGRQMSGYYKYDDEGVKPQKVSIIENGILKNFLASRDPMDTYKVSNGHGRAQGGMPVVTRQSNMVIKSDPILPMAELKKMLIEECRKQGKEYGLLFDEVVGGFTTTGRYMPNAFNVTPLVVYKIYVDGRPDELVRGVDLVGTPLTVFSNIELAGDEFGVFNGYCGAESGSVPVGCISPSVLVNKIEVQKKIKSQEKPPILVRPDLDKLQ